MRYLAVAVLALAFAGPISADPCPPGYPPGAVCGPNGQPLPEPESIALLGIGAAALVISRLKKK